MLRRKSDPIRRRPAAQALLLGCLLLGACATDGGSRSRSGRIDEVHLFGLPVAVNLDPVPGPDGFSIRVYASSTAEPRGVAIRDGSLEVLLFDGAVAPGQAPTGQPLRTWTFTPAQLKRLATENRLGTGYELTLQWSGTPPTRNRVTVFARYIPPAGPAIVSGPSAVTLSLR